MGKHMINDIQFETGSGNVFEDLGVKNAEEMLLKAQLVVKIARAIKTNHLTQEQAAELMGISQDKVSNLLRGNFSRISEKKLMTCLTKLGYDIEINIKQANTKTGHLMIA